MKVGVWNGYSKKGSLSCEACKSRMMTLIFVLTEVATELDLTHETKGVKSLNLPQAEGLPSLGRKVNIRINIITERHYNKKCAQ